VLYQAVRVNIILSWVTFSVYEALPSLGYFTQTDVVYQAWVLLPSLGLVTQPEDRYPSWKKEEKNLGAFGPLFQIHFRHMVRLTFLS
jgi:hypothetical protein